MRPLTSLSQFVSSHVEDHGTRLFLTNLWRERTLFVLTVVLSLAAAVFEGVGIGLLVPFLNGLMEPESAALSTGWHWFDEWILASNQSTVWRLYQVSLLILAAIWLRVTLGYFSAVSGVRLKESIAHKLRVELIQQIQNVSLSFFSKKKSGDFLNALTNQINRLRNLFDHSSQFLQKIFLLLVYLTAMVWISWELSLFAVAFCAALFLMLTQLIGRIRKHGTEIFESDQRLMNVAAEIVNGIRTIATFGTKGFESSRFANASASSSTAQVEASRRAALVGPLSQGIASTGLIAMILVAVHFFVMSNQMSGAALLTFFFALFRLLPIVQQLNSTRSMWAVEQSSLSELAEMLRQDNKTYLSSGTRSLQTLEKGFVLEDVTFGYDADHPVLHDINTSIELGKTTAIVGGSGAGKTTLVDLVARLHDPVQGHITLDGYDLRDYKIDDLRNRISIVSQNTFLFHDTVTNNIAYGLEDIPDEDIRWAAEKANALEFIENLEEGFDTQLGDRGERLSGGQRQRISIARALLRDPEILILDEATSALDSVTENLVQESLSYLMEDRTVIVIAHRLSTVEDADHVIVMENGRIVEQGHYSDLLAQEGQLWIYHNLQYQMA